MSTLTARSTSLYRDVGYRVENVETVLRHPDKKSKPCPVCKRFKEIVTRRDFHGIADLHASSPKPDPRIAINHRDVVLIQVTDITSMPRHQTLVLGERFSDLLWLLQCGYRFEMHGWVKDRGKWAPPGSSPRWREWWVRVLEFYIAKDDRGATNIFRRPILSEDRGGLWPIYHGMDVRREEKRRARS